MNIKKLIVKYINREANVHELKKLDSWLKEDTHLPLFNKFVRTEYLTNLSMAAYDVDKAKKVIKQKIKLVEQKKRNLRYRKLAIAASVLLLMALFFFRTEPDIQKVNIEVTKVSQPAPEIGSDKAVLTLENGNQVALGKGKDYQSDQAKSDGSEIVYNTSQHISSDTPQYNYLTIPRGGQFFIKLADGTQVWLNSDSKLKYPVAFQKGKTRLVELVYGEAYFKVSPSSKHNGTEFHVLSKSQEIGVLGTEFNLKAYNDEAEVSTTLVEGKVKVQKDGISKTLKPSQQSTTYLNTNEIEVQEVDVSLEISWVKGLFTFNEKSLGEIMTTLSRWYNVDVVFENAAHKNFLFTGIIERTETVDHILGLIEATSDNTINFQINERTIIIN